MKFFLLGGAIIFALIGLINCEKKLIGYYESWAYYRSGNGQFTVDDIDPYSFTHLNYAFFGITIDGDLRINDLYLDLDDDYGLGNIRRFNELKLLNPSLKTLAAVGGFNEGSAIFSQVAADPVKRRNFAINARDFCAYHGFDGIDMDWEYPGQGDGSSIYDRDNFVLLLQELYNYLHPSGYILTAAVAASSTSASISYDIPNMSTYLTYINIMTYDFHGYWENTIGHNAPMYAGPADITEAQKTYNVYASITYWLAQGAPRDKVILGMPFYGRTFTLRYTSETSPGAYNNGPGNPGTYTNEAGYIGYNEVCSIQWVRNWDNIQLVPYKFQGDQWISYDDIESIEIKSLFAVDFDLGGGMIWAIDTDDFRGLCGQGRNPLLQTMYSILRQPRIKNG